MRAGKPYLSIIESEVITIAMEGDLRTAGNSY
jgi:hypothetical protein